MLSLAKVQMLERRGGKGTEELRRSTILGPPPYLSAYIVYYVTRIVDWMGRRILQITDCRLHHPMDFIGISGPSGT